MLSREEEEEDDDGEKNWPGDENKHDLFCSLKANSFKSGIKH